MALTPARLSTRDSQDRILLNSLYMKTRLLFSLARAVCCFSLCMLVRVGLAQSNLVLLVSQPGDYIGAGNVYVTTNPASFSFSSNPTFIGISAFGFWIQFSPPYQSVLAVGSYTNVPGSVTAPMVSVSGNSRGCSQYCGNFQVLEVHTNDVGAIDRFWATFTQNCECFMAPMSGEVRYNSQLAPPVPASRTLRVPSQYATIQTGLDAASPLAVDTVLVAGGVYSEIITFRGKTVQLVSESGPTFTTIQGPNLNTVVTFIGTETTAAMLSGFRVQSSVGQYSAGIVLNGASPLVANNMVLGCQTGIAGGASSAVIRSNTIQNSFGSGISFGGPGSALIEGNTVSGNQLGIALSAAAIPVVRNNFVAANHGDGINVAGYSDAEIIQNIIASNTGNGLSWQVPAGRRGPRAINNTFYQNTVSGIFADGYDTNSLIMNNIVVGTPALKIGSTGDTNFPVILYNDFFSQSGTPYSGLATNFPAGAGNISTNPLFACERNGNWHLVATSPCIDAGTNDSLLAVDFDGRPRLLDGNLDGTAVVDMGAFELDPAAAPQPCLYINCPSSMSVTGLPGQPTVAANHPPPVGHPAAQITSSPPSGSAFPGGTNLVTCTAAYGSNSVSCAFTVIVNTWPGIAQQPQNVYVPAGTSASFTVTVTNATTPITYQWWKQIVGVSTNIVATTNSSASVDSYTAPLIWATNSGTGYFVVLRNAAGAVTSSVATVTVPPAQFNTPFIFNGSNIVLNWSGGGVLQFATNLAGPWLQFTNAQSPYTNAINPTQPQGFFRARQ
jgi:parallel beta-helix repeat protein